jgi:alpha-2-macroglobulin
MSVKRAAVPTLLLSCGAVLLATVSGAPGAAPQARPSPKASPTPSPKASPAAITGDPWKEVDRLVAEQKYEAASSLVARLREEARGRKDEDAWTRALIREVQVRSALHGYETAVRFLREQPWPEGALARATLDLFYGQSLVQYLQAYSWEIRNRERVESKEAVDLKRWTAEQIGEEAQRAYARVWAQREALGTQPATRLGDFLKRGTYPERVRGTLRDVLSYLLVELLVNTSYWSPAQHELYRLDVAALLGPVTTAVEDVSAHPVTRLAAVLTDLEGWHAAAGRPEAALEARLERSRRLHAVFTDAEDRRRIREDLEGRLPQARQLEWWAAGQEVLAELVSQQDAPDALVRARAIAKAGADAYPDSIGGKRSQAIVARIEAPSYRLTAMTLDGPRQRSIQVDHRNLPRLYLRAYTVDLADRLRTSRDYNLLPAWREIPELVKTARPAAEWTADLAATPDFRNHVTYVTPPLERPGLYVVVASARPEFPRGDADNQLQAVNLVVSDLVLVHRNLGDKLEVTATSGRTGGPLVGAVVELWRLDWQKGHSVAATQTTDASGTVRLSPSRSTQFAVLGRHQDQVSLTGHVYWNVTPPMATRRSSLVYTDRSVYRPGQRLLWKVVAYEGGGEESVFRTSAGAAVQVRLEDANDELVDTKKVTTNEFGSAAGEFVVPPGRLLGEWSVVSTVHDEDDADAIASVRVEEYKRPTFEVSLLDPEKEVRLNHAAELTGEARYYFGLPVTTGKVAWRVTRQAVRPWWWWWHPHFDARSRVVASGQAALAADGRFKVAFTPEADARASRELTWSYELSADVTDEGGETRSAARRFRLGFVSVEAQVTDAPGFLLADHKAPLSLLRTDLDGTPRAGAAQWTLFALQQPGRTLLPAEQPQPPPAEKAAPGHRTPGDELRPRHNPDYSAERTLALWPDGAAVTQGSLQHDAKGVAILDLPPLKAGAYRLRYESKDEGGGTFRMAKELVVAQARGTPLALPGILAVERASVPVGGTARLLVHSGLEGQAVTVELWRSGRRTEVRRLVAGRDPQVLEIPVGAADRGGFGVTLSLVRDHQLVHDSAAVFVPWSDRELKVGFATFRDRLRPGAKETWRVTVSSTDPRQQPIAAAEVLAYMYDRSLDLFQPHVPASLLALYPNRTSVGTVQANLGGAGPQWQEGTLGRWASGPSLQPDRLDFWSGYGIGGPGRRRLGSLASRADGPVPPPPPPPASAPAAANEVIEVQGTASLQMSTAVREELKVVDGTLEEAAAPAPMPLRTNFSETAFWQPQLLTGPDGSATFEFTVPDSVTSWSVWTHALTRDLRAGSERRETRSVKDLMVRPYLPRFLREGDEAEIKVVVNNASTSTLSGEVTLEIQDPTTQRDLGAEFGLQGGGNLAFQAPPSGSANVTVKLVAPRRLDAVAVKVVARAGDLSDGEVRALPVLPSRLHLIESRFATLKGASSRTLSFPALARTDDPTRQTEQLVVTLDGQLFYGVLEALPYLVNYPYECTEQTLNRFVSTGILSSLFTKYPAVARMAKEMSARDTGLEVWDKDDPNRRMELEETPWAAAARGGAEKEKDLVKVLDPRIARATREEALAKLEKAQTSVGGFPWFPGGPPSPYMTLYITYGLAKAREFGVEVPQEMVKKAFGYLHQHYLDEWVRESVKCDCGWEFVTFLGYVLTAYPDDSWTGGVFTDAERRQMLDFSFKHWKEHSPYLKGYLALTLHRRGRPRDAALVWDSVMDSAKTDADTGTSWAPEDRGWLWYNDTIETHAFALRTLGELRPKDPRREGLVQWLFLNKKLNHWRSTRATSEVLYALAHYLKEEGQLGVREEATVKAGSRTATFVFEPERYTGKGNQMVVPGATVDAEKISSVVVEKPTPGMMFASATWHYATDRLPEDEAGDLFGVSRRYFRRENKAGTWTLTPLSEGAALAPGDELEVHLSLRARQAAEYVHLRDPRGAGFEPVTLVSGFKWETGVGFYEEVRDSGENFFFEWLPAGEYGFRYRVRAAHAGTFRVGPAQVQSMYAPEFAARSAGHTLQVQPAE